MLDIAFIRENSDLIDAAAKKKHLDFDVKKLLKVDNERLAVLKETEELRRQQNEASKKIAEANNDKRSELIESVRGLKSELQKKEEELQKVTKKWQKLMLAVPNIPDISVPEGASEEENVEASSWGEKPNFSFTPKSHIELLEGKGMLDLERGAKVAGFRGYVLKRDLVKLSMALWQFVIDEFTQKGDYMSMMVPSLVKRETLIGTGYLPQGEEDLYQTIDGDFLAGTAEAATMGYLMNETVPKEALPLKFLAFSPCFRREAGSHGKDTKGLMRVHEFFKWEQVILCEASHQVSVEHHEELRQNAEDLMQALELPYRVVVNCGADLGLGQVKKYDIESMVPIKLYCLYVWILVEIISKIS